MASAGKVRKQVSDCWFNLKFNLKESEYKLVQLKI